MQPSAPPPPPPPAIGVNAAPQIVQGSAPDVYQAFRAQRRELGRQMESLEDRRGDLSRQLQAENIDDADKAGLRGRLSEVDQRISALDKQISAADQQVATAAAVPGAAVEPPAPPRQGPPEEAFVLGGIFIVVVCFPMAVAFSRRLWRRGAAATMALPRELLDRLSGIDHAVESIAVEVERIGEGQRFMTRAFNDAAPSLGAGVAQQVERVAEKIEARR